MYISIHKFVLISRVVSKSECMNFAVNFITNPFQERDISESAELVPFVFKENVSEVELINL